MAKLVKLYPVEGVSLYPYPAVECEVEPDVAEFLLSHSPPPFTRTPPKQPEAVDASKEE